MKAHSEVSVNLLMSRVHRSWHAVAPSPKWPILCRVGR